VTLACPHDEPVTKEQLDHVEQLTHRVITFPQTRTKWLHAGTRFVSGRSITEGVFFNRQLSRQILQQHQSTPFEAAVVFCSSMYPYVSSKPFDDLPKIVDLVDVDSKKLKQLADEASGAKRAVYHREFKTIRKLEQQVADQTDAVVLVSEDEAELFRQEVPGSSPVYGISNGVDTEFFRPPEVDRSDRTANCQLVFTGVMDYTPNIEGMLWFCNEIFPRFHEQTGALLKIVGRRPVSAIEKLNNLPGVEVTGEVPDVRPYLEEADIAVSPLKLARGIQNKVLEAMASGLPVISTKEAAEGIDGQHDTEFLIADSVAEWQGSLQALSTDPQQRQRIGQAARQKVEAHYGWHAKLSPIINLIETSRAATRG
jgi:sugar transferase (PEP-CTERM/EpsH1 system associated)